MSLRRPQKPQDRRTQNRRIVGKGKREDMDKEVFKKRIEKAEKRWCTDLHQLDLLNLIARVGQSIALELEQIKIELKERR